MRKKYVCFIVTFLITLVVLLFYFTSDRKKIIINNFIPEQNSTHTAYADGTYYYYDKTSGFSGIRKLKDGHTEDFLKTKDISCISATKDYVYFVEASTLYQVTRTGKVIAEVKLSKKYEYISMTSKSDDLWINGVVWDDSIGVEKGVINIFSLEDIQDREKIKFKDMYETKQELIRGNERIYRMKNYCLNQKNQSIYLKEDVLEEEKGSHKYQKNCIGVPYEFAENLLCNYDKQTGNKLLNVPDAILGIKNDKILGFDNYFYYHIQNGKVSKMIEHNFCLAMDPWCIDFDYNPTIKLDGDNMVVVMQKNKVHFFPGFIGATPQPNEKLKYHVQDRVVLMDMDNGKIKEDFKTRKKEKILFADSRKILTIYNDEYRLYDYERNILKKIKSRISANGGVYYSELCNNVVFVYKNSKVVDKIEL